MWLIWYVFRSDLSRPQSCFLHSLSLSFSCSLVLFYTYILPFSLSLFLSFSLSLFLSSQSLYLLFLLSSSSTVSLVFILALPHALLSLSHPLSFPLSSSYSLSQILADVDDLVDVISASNGTEIDVQSLFFKFTFDAICQIAFGIRPHAVKKDDVPVLDAFDRYVSISLSLCLRLSQYLSLSLCLSPIFSLPSPFSLFLSSAFLFFSSISPFLPLSMYFSSPILLFLFSSFSHSISLPYIHGSHNSLLLQQ